MRADRLLKLADHLETVVAKTPERFDMTKWGKESPDCGTVCCAVGHACAIPEFKAAGLSLEWLPRATAGDSHATPTFNGLDAFEAVEEFFGLSEDDAEFLFEPASYQQYATDEPITPQEVAARIRDLASRRKHTVPAVA